jgi:hypothetical protein
MIVQHIKRKRGGRVVKVGTIVGRAFGDTACVGFSKCKITGDGADTFDKQEGIDIALCRAADLTNGVGHRVPQSIQKDVAEFSRRAEAYFQDKKVISP